MEHAIQLLRSRLFTLFTVAKLVVGVFEVTDKIINLLQEYSCLSTFIKEGSIYQYNSLRKGLLQKELQ